MDEDLRELYREVILDHNRNPRNFGEMEGADRRAEGFNPLCGDRITVFLEMDGDAIRRTMFVGSGCAISKASASVMTELLQGKTREEAEQIFRRFHDMVTGEDDSEVDIMESGEVAALAGVKQFPLRIKCATLAWHTLRSALHGRAETVSTE